MITKYLKGLIFAGLILIDGLFFGMINPRQAHAVIIIIGFGLLVGTFYAGFDLLLGLLRRAISFSDTLRHRIHTSATILCGLLLAMQSIGQLTGKDLLVFVPLVLVVSFYLSYQRKENA